MKNNMLFSTIFFLTVSVISCAGVWDYFKNITAQPWQYAKNFSNSAKFLQNAAMTKQAIEEAKEKIIPKLEEVAQKTEEHNKYLHKTFSEKYPRLYRTAQVISRKLPLVEIAIFALPATAFGLLVYRQTHKYSLEQELREIKRLRKKEREQENKEKKESHL